MMAPAATYAERDVKVSLEKKVAKEFTVIETRLMEKRNSLENLLVRKEDPGVVEFEKKLNELKVKMQSYFSEELEMVAREVAKMVFIKDIDANGGYTSKQQSKMYLKLIRSEDAV